MCKTLFEEIEGHGGKQAPALLKHLKAVGIQGWETVTRSKLFDLLDELKASVAASTARTYTATLKGLFARYEDEITLPDGWREILKVKGQRPLKIWLTPQELAKLAAVQTNNAHEKTVLFEFLTGAFTGMRISDTRNASIESVADGQLTYVSQKTKVQATVPCGERVTAYITWLRDNGRDISLAGYNEAIRRLCRRAGIRTKVKVFKAGQTETGEKWQFVSSHTARISFCTNLAEFKVPLLDISRMAGHSSTAMTERYIVNKRVTLPAQAQKYFE